MTAAVVLGGLYLLWQVREVIVWCVIALFVAAALNPAVNWLQRRRIKRVIAILLAYLGLLLGMIGTIALLVPLLVSQVEALARALLERETLDEEEILEATGLPPAPPLENGKVPVPDADSRV